ncbi:MAG: sigma-54 dependent transcriptional regulator [Pseudomonadales bacterium]
MNAPVVVVAQDAQQGDWLCRRLVSGGFEARPADDAAAALRLLGEHGSGLCLSHASHATILLQESRLAAPMTPVVVVDEQARVETAVAMMRGGAVDYLDLNAADERLLGAVRQHYRAGGQQDVIKASPQSQQLFDLAGRVAQTDVSVLITGESGTGKEVVARYIHNASPRSAGPFVAINCAAIPENMLEAILFGHVKGAFTGAHQSQPGKFELASGGTLLLDEIGEMPLSLQAKLLRVLQEREVERVGARAPVAIDVRVLATTNVDIRQAVAEGRFREDLYYRLSVFPLQLAPLRERPQDVAALVEHFLRKHGGSFGRAPRIAPQTLLALTRERWPGNVRELENAVQRALVLGAGDELSATEFGLGGAPSAVTRIASGAQGNPAQSCGSALSERRQDAESEVILRALAANSGHRRRTAEQLGVSERTLRYKLQRLRDQGVEV